MILGFFLKFLGFFRFQCTKKTGHKIPTQEEHPTNHCFCHIVFYKSCQYTKREHGVTLIRNKKTLKLDF